MERFVGDLVEWPEVVVGLEKGHCYKLFVVNLQTVEQFLPVSCYDDELACMDPRGWGLREKLYTGVRCILGMD